MDGDSTCHRAVQSALCRRADAHALLTTRTTATPAYLLLNDGRGNFTDATDAAGLWQETLAPDVTARRFADLDGDGHLDLLVVSDFAALMFTGTMDAGHFTDVTREWISRTTRLRHGARAGGF